MSGARTSGGRTGDTRARILAIAGDLFARQGYTGTTISDIARELGTTTAALYYHFPAKADILAGLLAEPLETYRRIIGAMRSGDATPEGLLAAFIDLTADSRGLATVIDRDPTVLAKIEELLPVTSAELTSSVIDVLAGPGADAAAAIRAHAAFAVVKGATLAALQARDAGGDGGRGGGIDPADRAEILAAALRALQGGVREHATTADAAPRGSR